MATIVRCPNCISLVYDGAEVCHHCGEELTRKKRRILSKGAIGFILLAVTAFGVGDAIYLAKERAKFVRFDRAAIKTFLEAVAEGDMAEARRRFRGRKNDEEELTRLRADLLEKFGDHYEIDVGEAQYRGSGLEFISWGNHSREIEVRRHEVPVKYRRAKSREPWQHTFLTVSVESWYYRGAKIVDVEWPGRTSNIIRVKAPSGG